MFCEKCQSNKDGSEFYATQKSECKECTRVRVRNNRRVKQDYYRAYDRARGNRQPKDYLSKYRSENSEKYKAHTAVSNAVRDGKLKRGPCFMCGNSEVHGHHVDYSKPLDVIWLCATCHQRVHAYEELANKIRS